MVASCLLQEYNDITTSAAFQQFDTLLLPRLSMDVKYMLYDTLSGTPEKRWILQTSQAKISSFAVGWMQRGQGNKVTDCDSCLDTALIGVD